MAAVTLKTIVRDYPEPQRTDLLKRLKSEARAFIVTYRPGKKAPEHRRHALHVGYGIPRRKIVFEAGKPKACDLGLAVFVLNQYGPRSSKVPSLRWGDEWDVDESDPIIVEKLPDDAKEAMAARKLAREKLGKDSPPIDDGSDEDAGDEAGHHGDDGGADLDSDPDEGFASLAGMKKADLLEVFATEIGHEAKPDDFQDGKVTVANLLEAIRSNRSDAGAEDDEDFDDDEDDGDDPTTPVE